MASTASTRFWRVYSEAGRPIPRLSDDDVLDYMTLEALVVKMRGEEKEAEKEAKRNQWRKDHSSLDSYR